jgi:hypothetical protein
MIFYPYTEVNLMGRFYAAGAGLGEKLLVFTRVFNLKG